MTAAIYARKSTDQSGIADEQKSVARQVEHGHAYAARKGWSVADEHIFIDDGISGAEFAKRPGYMRLLNAAGSRRAPFDVLIVSELSRLGREQLETGYAVKQLAQAGVKIFQYLDDREVALDSPMDKFMLAAVNFGAEIEREKARQRQVDTMTRKAHAGHVTGGACFGYRNVDVAGADGRRSHVDRVIDLDQAAIIRRIFELSAAGYGFKAIAKILNGDAAPSPRAQCGRSQSWAPTSVRDALFRPLYRGEIVYGRTAKRDRWGRVHQAARPSTDWIQRDAPHLRIISDELWAAAHARIEAARAIYLHGTGGQRFGRPALGNPSKYLLTNLAACGTCGGSLKTRTRAHGGRRAFYYGCSGYHDRGRSVCTNNADVPMADADGIVIEALLDDVLDETIIRDSVDEALQLLRGDDDDRRGDRVDTQLGAIAVERARLMAAIGSGKQVTGLLEALQALDDRQARVEADRAAVRTPARLQASDAKRVRAELLELAGAWRQVLVDDPLNARPIVTSLLIGRVTVTASATPKGWDFRGEGTLSGFFARELLSLGNRIPLGTPPPSLRSVGDVPTLFG